MIGRFISRVRNLERAQPQPGDNDAFRERLDRARQRVADMMPDAEWEASQTPEALATEEARTTRVADVEEAARRRGRKPLIADMVRASRT